MFPGIAHHQEEEQSMRTYAVVSGFISPDAAPELVAHRPARDPRYRTDDYRTTSPRLNATVPPSTSFQAKLNAALAEIDRQGYPTPDITFSPPVFGPIGTLVVAFIGYGDQVAAPQKQMYRVDEVAAVLNVSETTIRDRCRAGDIRSTRIGSAVRIPAREVDRLRAGKPRETADETA